MSSFTPIPKIRERIEQLDTAIFSGAAGFWRYPACIIRHIKVDRSGHHLWFKMNNVSLDDPGGKAPAFLFCYNKRHNFYITIEGDAFVSGLAGDLRAPEGWQDPIYAHQTTYLIRLEMRYAALFPRAASSTAETVLALAGSTGSSPAAIAPGGKTRLFPERLYTPPILIKKPSITHLFLNFRT